MTPDQFLSQLGRGAPAPVYLFLGPEGYRREECRLALLDRALGVGEREGFDRLDLDEATLSAVLDDACSMSLFASRRVLWVGRSEAALPRGRAAAVESDDGDGKVESGGAAQLEAYLRNPVPDVTIVFDSSRFEFEGEDKTKTERVRKFFGAVSAVVEFPRYTAMEARRLAQDLAGRLGLRLGAEQLQLLVEATGNSAGSIAMEMEKLSLYAKSGNPIDTAAIAQLVPQAGSATIFLLVAALGRKDRNSALALLDTLVRGGEYLPLALSFLATQFRQALVAAEAGLRSAGQVQGHFSRLGVPMWPSRAEQVAQTAGAFRPTEMREALVRIAAADKALRDIRPDDRVVMEQFVLQLTG